jgi:hypothetical protein
MEANVSCMRWLVPAALLATSAAGHTLTAQAPTLDVRFVTDEAEAVLAILEGGVPPAPGTAAWSRLVQSEGYRRLKARETDMGRPFTDSTFRAFVASDSLAERAGALRRTLDAWTSADVAGAAAAAFAYLPAGSTIRATVYPVIKPWTNSFVYDLEGDPAIFLYVDPAVTPAQLETTVAHELHHVGFASACPDPAEGIPPGVATALAWSGGLGEGLAVLAAAGGPDAHPHAASEPAARAVWDRNVKHVERDMARIEAFLLALVEGGLEDESAIRRRGFQLIVAEEAPQGPFYTVGWLVGATVERELGRAHLVAALCEPVELMAAYNRAAGLAERGGGARLPRWSEALIRALRGVPGHEGEGLGDGRGEGAGAQAVQDEAEGVGAPDLDLDEAVVHGRLEDGEPGHDIGPEGEARAVVADVDPVHAQGLPQEP